MSHINTTLLLVFSSLISIDEEYSQAAFKKRSLQHLPLIIRETRDTFLKKVLLHISPMLNVFVR